MEEDVGGVDEGTTCALCPQAEDNPGKSRTSLMWISGKPIPWRRIALHVCPCPLQYSETKTPPAFHLVHKPSLARSVDSRLFLYHLIASSTCARCWAPNSRWIAPIAELLQFSKHFNDTSALEVALSFCHFVMDDGSLDANVSIAPESSVSVGKMSPNSQAVAESNDLASGTTLFHLHWSLAVLRSNLRL